MTNSAIVTDLIDEGLLCETGERSAMKQGGWKPILLTLTVNKKYALGVDVGLTNMAVAISDLKGHLLFKQKVLTRRNHILESILEQILEQILELIDIVILVSRIKRTAILGIGLSIGGLVNKRTGYISLSPDFNWKDVSLQTLMEEASGFPVVIDNCTRSMALGEMWYGNTVAIDNFFYVNVVWNRIGDCDERYDL